MLSADYFLEKADQCFLLCRAPESELRSHFEELAYEFLTKAAELDTIRERMDKGIRAEFECAPSPVLLQQWAT
jgi:hypothetical protein